MRGNVTAVVRVEPQRGADPIPTVNESANALAQLSALQDATQHAAVMAALDQLEFWLQELDADIDRVTTQDTELNDGVRVVVPDDSGQQRQLQIIAATKALAVADVGVRLGKVYATTTGLIAGSGAIQNFFSVHNTGSKRVWLRRIDLITGFTAVSPAQFLVHLSRAAAAPAGGTVVPLFYTDTDDPTPHIEVRQSPTGTVIAGDFFAWWPSGSSVSSGGAAKVDPIAAPRQGEDVLLKPGQAVMVWADANATAFRLVGRVLLQAE